MNTARNESKWRGNSARRTGRAFTLIEMLVVIAIIGIVAALVVNLTAGAQAAKRNAVVNSEKAKLQMMIENYQAKLNYFPPDNGNLATPTTTSLGSAQYYLNYDGWAATNPLLYELTGAIITNNNQGIQAFDGSQIPIASVSTVFERSSVNNSDPTEHQNFFQPMPSPKEYAAYATGQGQTYSIYGLIVPVPLVTSSTNIAGSVTNFWHYDSSSTNRHNLNSYDLWAEYTVGSKNGATINITNGNW
jgi:prepilin-type N-terminal cleavage/methylation domain-containing protein